MVISICGSFECFEVSPTVLLTGYCIQKQTPTFCVIGLMIAALLVDINAIMAPPHGHCNHGWGSK